MISANLSADRFFFRQIGWKSYNHIRKKAMEQEFSWSGLIISVSIAFFIVCALAQVLYMVEQTVEKEMGDNNLNKNIYKLEDQIIQSVLKNKEKNQNFFNNINLASIFIKSASAASEEYKAEALKFTDNISSETNKEIEYVTNIKNIGNSVWFKDKVFFETGPFLKSFSPVKHQKWTTYFRAANLSRDIKPGETAAIKFFLRMPAEAGIELQQNFQLVINNQPIKGSMIRLFIKTNAAAPVATKNQTTVTPAVTTAQSNSNASANTTATTVKKSDFCIALSEDEKKSYAECSTALIENDQTNGISQSASLIKEPIIRVGLFNTLAAQRITCDTFYDIYGGDQLILSGLAPGTVMIASYDFSLKQYAVSSPSITKFSKKQIRFVPRDQSGIITLLDQVNKTNWSTAYNDNLYRNVMELRYSDTTKKLWLINELPIENYLKGLAETTNYSPLEFQKVLVTAARTYAMYHYNRGAERNMLDCSTKHADEYFHVDATYDQVYRGYGSEKRMPKLVEAINATRGVLVTYGGKGVITPYFSRSDGRTRSWEEVWGGTKKPWLSSVAVPQDTGQTLWGHGVGMSARGALVMTRDENKTWQETLKYFYSGTELKKFY